MTNSLCQHLRKCSESSMENMHTNVRVLRLCISEILVNKTPRLALKFCSCCQTRPFLKILKTSLTTDNLIYKISFYSPSLDFFNPKAEEKNVKIDQLHDFIFDALHFKTPFDYWITKKFPLLEVFTRFSTLEVSCLHVHVWGSQWGDGFYR